MHSSVCTESDKVAQNVMAPNNLKFTTIHEVDELMGSMTAFSNEGPYNVVMANVLAHGRSTQTISNLPHYERLMKFDCVSNEGAIIEARSLM